MHHVATVLQSRAVDLVIDVGANTGQFATMIRQGGYAGRIASFEPVSANLGPLRSNAADDPLWTIHPIALGRENARRRINVSRHTVFSSFLTPNEYGLTRFVDEAVVANEEVEVRRLDDVFEGLATSTAGPRTYLKLDTQGWDLEVLAGAERSLDRVVALQTEISMRAIYEGMPAYREMLADLEALGFAVTGLYPVTRDPDLRVIEYDCVLVRT